MAVLRLQIGVLDPDEGPLGSVNGCSRAVGQVAHRQGGFRLLRVGGRIGQVLPVGQQEHLGRFVALELAHDPAGQRPLRADGFRRVQSDQSGSGRHVGLPATPDHCVTTAHQVAVAGFQWRGGVIGSGNAVQAEGGLAAPIHYVEQNAAVAPVDVHRLEHGKVCRKLHAAGRIARRKFQVSDPLIAGCAKGPPRKWAVPSRSSYAPTSPKLSPDAKLLRLVISNSVIAKMPPAPTRGLQSVYSTLAC